MRNRIWVALTLLIVLSTLLMSCGTKSTTTATTTTTTKTAAQTTTAATTAATTVTTTVSAGDTVVDALGRTVEKPQYGGTLILVAIAEQPSFDPYLIDQVNVWSYHLTNEKLSVGDFTKGPSGTGEVSWLMPGIWDIPHEVGEIATSWEIMGTDKVIFYIRQGIHFQDKAPVYGRELTADDVVASLQRAYAPGTFMGNSFGAGKATDYSPSSIVATDKWTVEVTCPPGQFGGNVQFMNVGTRICAKETLTANASLTDWKVECGTGPFVLTDFVRDSTMTFTANPTYWRDHPLYPGMKMPFVSTIRRLVIVDLSTRIAAVQTGKIDMIRDTGTTDSLSLLNSRPDLKYINYLRYYGDFIWFRLDKDLPQKNLDVRRALSMAIDREAIMEGFYKGQAEKFCHPILPCGELADMFTPLNEMPQTVQENYTYNTEMAKALLAGAGYPDGFHCSIVSSQAYADLLSIIVDQWAEINVELTLDIREASVYSTITRNSTHDDMMVGIISNIYYTTPLTYLKAYIPTYNHSRGVDAYVEQYYAEEMAPLVTFHDTEFRAAMKAFSPYLLDLVWLIELPTPKLYTLWQPWLKCFTGEYSVGRGNHEDAAMYSWIDSKLKDAFIGK
ncbi:MAG: ABC transporter substrate-binding protein [Dehalococcoidales bacterium]|nr:ABC transporter substrate-binding protein [Dehalococcoidales bacterium]